MTIFSNIIFSITPWPISQNTIAASMGPGEKKKLKCLKMGSGVETVGDNHNPM